MANPFSRTIRSLHTDSFYVSIAGLLVALTLAGFWGHWFFTATITLYETSQQVYVTKTEVITSEFPQDVPDGIQRIRNVRRRVIVAMFAPEALGSIRPNQAAFLHLKGKLGKQIGDIPAIVTNVSHFPGVVEGQVELLAMIDAGAPNPFEEGGGGEVKIEVEYITPAKLVMRASGLFVEAPPASYSPQEERSK
jgi:hypothetical protein